MELYTTQQFCKKAPWLTPRIIIDIVSKGLVRPIKDSEGTGDHRLYSKGDIIEILVAASIRGMFSKKTMDQFMLLLKQAINQQEKTLVLTPTHARTSNRAGATVTIGKFHSIIPTSTKLTDIANQSGFVMVVINLERIVEFVETNF